MSLLPCPFDNGRAVFNSSFDRDDHMWHYVRCQKCGAQSSKIWADDPCPETYYALEVLWNTRA